ncbi:hypothetical protein CDD83_7286 [Cordyceps sp. RAO-2017]|nr:hypothetical protein CDD83_7286 [Cordyceps sp. RAO-2017]
MDLIPSDSFYAALAVYEPPFTRLSPAMYYACAERFIDAIRQGSSPWAVTFDTFDNGEPIAPAVLHDVGCIVRIIAEHMSTHYLALAMWTSASASGYRPSVLSTARHLVRSRRFGSYVEMLNVEARFERLVAKGDDPDALTVEGEGLFDQGRLALAVETLQRALSLPSSNFQWEHSCQLHLGMSLLKLGRTREARCLFEDLSQSGVYKADEMLADMLRTADPSSAQQHAYTASHYGRLEMFSRLAEMELLGVGSTDSDGRSPEERRLWATEWSRLANPRVEL